MSLGGRHLLVKFATKSFYSYQYPSKDLRCQYFKKGILLKQGDFGCQSPLQFQYYCLLLELSVICACPNFLLNILG